jgi:hypothetical protein
VQCRCQKVDRQLPCSLVGIVTVRDLPSHNELHDTWGAAVPVRHAGHGEIAPSPRQPRDFAQAGTWHPRCQGSRYGEDMGDWWVFTIVGMGIAFVMWVFDGP